MLIDFCRPVGYDEAVETYRTTRRGHRKVAFVISAHAAATASGEPDAWERATVWEACAEALDRLLHAED